MEGWTPPAGTTTRWMLACMAGLAVGFPLATLWGVLLVPEILPRAYHVGIAAMALRAAGGAILGGCLGMAQAWALRRIHPALSPLPWIGATAAAGYCAALASMAIFGLLMVQFGDLPGMGPILAGPVVSGLAGGLLYGLAQGLVLDRVVEGRAAWVWLVTLGWVLAGALASLRWMFGLVGYGPVAMASGAVIGGVLEGLALGLVTLRAFRLMPPRTATRPPP
ncbi:hypothetical protein AAFN86_11015 [Roseomonas sp. CAU 1739]|uniref:hypothetical protein n=1 Tax=Roseomonas sp. CAU 1739 TaxID=3140364 RepID=UPI00325B758C